MKKKYERAEIFRRIHIGQKFWIVEIISNKKGMFADREKNVMVPFDRNVGKICRAQLEILDPFRGKWKEGLELTCVVS